MLENNWPQVMEIYPISALLSDAGLSAPDLRVLRPNVENYSALLLQPQGDINAEAGAVRNADQVLAGKQYMSFLADAVAEDSDIAITPEYSMPWQVVEESLRSDLRPSDGAVWVLGCESITLEQLHAFRERVSDIATVLYEPLAPRAGRFLDPVLYAFHSKTFDGGDSSRLVIVVQFKTYPMRDVGHFEVNGLHTGTRVYVFGNGTTQLGLATIICSDAFAFKDAHALKLYHRTLVIHIQLNKSPRQAAYRRYRDKLMNYEGDEIEILCLNWAKDVHERHGEERMCWGNISGTAWYLRPDKYDDCDLTLAANHKNGLYYTWLHDLRCRALFFTYIPAVFAVTASKVAHHGVPAAVSLRRGPILDSTRVWDDVEARWLVTNPIDDGFAAIALQCGDAANDIESLASRNPFLAERTLALCAGQISESDWYGPTRLDSCLITTSEVVRRITACQDTDESARRFRTRRLRTALRVASLLRTQLPAAVKDLQGDFRFDWSPQSPHTNVVSTAGRRATAIYLDDEHTAQTAFTIAAKAADHIGEWETVPDNIIEGRQRLCVWYRDDQGIDVLCEPDRYVQYDEAHTESPFDITRSG